MTLSKQTRKKRQRGVAMIMALLALLLLAVIGMGFLFMTTTENSANTNYKDSQGTYFASRAGLENVRSMLWTNAALNTQVFSKLTMPQLGTNTGVIYVFNSNGADVIDPSSGAGATVATNPTLDDELCHEQYAGLLSTGPGTLLSAGTAGAPCGSGTGGATEVMPKNPSYYVPAALNAGDIPDTGTSSALAFKWVRITNKQNFMGLLNQNVDRTPVPSPTAGNQVCWDGVHEVAAASCAAWNLNPANLADQVNPVWLLTSLAITPSGSRRMTQMEVAFTPPISTNATIATSGTLQLTGAVTVNGDDDCTNNKHHLSIYSGECVPGANGCGAAINNQVPPDQLTGDGYTGVTTYDSTTGAITSQGSTGQGAWPYNIDQLISQYKQMAQSATGSPWDYKTNCSGNNCKVQNEQFGTFPTDPVTGQLESAPTAADGTPAIVYVPGDLHLTSQNATGDGLLIVNGDLTVDGGMTYYGLILVKGQIHFTGGGTGAGGKGGGQNSQNVNIFGSVLAGDSASAADAVGGSFNFHYSSCALNQTAPPGPPKLLATHEIMY